MTPAFAKVVHGSVRVISKSQYLGKAEPCTTPSASDAEAGMQTQIYRCVHDSPQQ